MNKKLYEKLEMESAKCHIDEEVEDIFLDITKMLADENVLGKEINCRKTIGHIPLEVVSFREAGEEYPDEASICAKTLTVAGTVCEIEGYLL